MTNPSTPAPAPSGEVAAAIERLNEFAAGGYRRGLYTKLVSDLKTVLSDQDALATSCVAHRQNVLTLHARALAAEAKAVRLRAKLDAERAGAETLDEAGMDANDKLSVLAALVIDLKVGTPYGQKVKAYARYVLGRGPDPTREVLPHEQEGSESYALSPAPASEGA